MRLPRTFAIAILASVLVLTTVVPASGAIRIRVYRGETSQEHIIKFQVARTEAGRRYLRDVYARNLTAACEDGTTQTFGAG
jgi:multidrug efflux pump subunit AcrB